MASMWRQAMLYLGLGPDEQYDELDELQHPGTSTLSASRGGRTRHSCDQSSGTSDTSDNAGQFREPA